MGSVRVLVVDDLDALGRTGAELVTEAVASTPRPRVVVATGMTPLGLYAELATRRAGGSFDPRGITAIQLDEYLDLDPDDDRSLFAWMRRSFLDPLGVPDDRVISLPLDGDLGAAGQAHDAALETGGGIDLAILGLGPNGHVGFNEPPSDRRSPTRAVELAPTTIGSNARYWTGAPVPTRAVTLGLGPLLSASKVVLLVAGEHKRSIVHRALEGPVGPEVPASYLQEAHGDVVAVVDRAAWGSA